ncbi:MAG: hypothetical protein SWO11_14245 [Thermodesulfobacteriota bacterium]|nr:hypothetical protein [Thermodesulfobacteriota bacterium]
MKRYRTPVYISLIFFFFTASLIMVRAYFESRGFYTKGIEAFSNDDTYMAILYFGRSANWYFPGNPYVKHSIEGLWKVACKTEESGEIGFALKACYTLRGSLYGTKWFFIHHKEWLEKSNQKIAKLTVARHPHIQSEKVIAELNKEKKPRVVWAFLVVMSFLSWVGSALGLIFFSFDSNGNVKGKRAVVLGGLILGFFLLWIFSMLRA